MAKRGPANRAVHILSPQDYDRNFGGLSADSAMSYAVSQFFLNGGSEAWVVRLAKNAQAASVTLKDGSSKEVLTITALDEGPSGNDIQVTVDDNSTDKTIKTGTFNLTFTYNPPDRPADNRTEVYKGLSMDQTSERFVEDMINDISLLVKVEIKKNLPAGTVLATQKPTAGSLTSGVFAANDLDTLPSDTQNKFQISFDGTHFTEISIGTSKASGSTLAEKLQDVAKRLQKAVQEEKPGITAWRDFSCTVADGNKLVLTSGVIGNGSSVQVHEAAVSANGIAKSLHLLEGATAKAGGNPKLGSDEDKQGKEETFDLNDDGLDVIFPSDPQKVDEGQGMFALDKVDLFNLLCLPGVRNAAVIAKAIAYCVQRRAFMIVDPPSSQDPLQSQTREQMVTFINGPFLPKGTFGDHAALYYPNIKIADPLLNGKFRSFAPCGTVAGVYARTDGSRGVWKAPAGTEATLVGVQGLDQQLNDNDNGVLNPHGVNCLRIFPVFGAVSWGARTVSGDDQIGSEYKYIPVRRTALYIEESLYRGLKWAVFEPNDEPLWAQIRLNVGAFMQNLFRQGAFQGQSPREAYFVKCDKGTTTQNDINLGIVNVVVGFAPLKPAEFVIIKLQQMAGQIQV
jgi:hypothetical protein